MFFCSNLTSLSFLFKTHVLLTSVNKGMACNQIYTANIVLASAINHQLPTKFIFKNKFLRKTQFYQNTMKCRCLFLYFRIKPPIKDSRQKKKYMLTILVISLPPHHVHRTETSNIQATDENNIIQIMVVVK